MAPFARRKSSNCVLASAEETPEWCLSGSQGFSFSRSAPARAYQHFFFTIEKHGLTTVFKFAGQFFYVLMLVVGIAR
ncbi:hypothetical protein O5903_00210 [Escherichia coli]|nr:hypothetical protein [Escherichia coli]